MNHGVRVGAPHVTIVQHGVAHLLQPVDIVGNVLAMFWGCLGEKTQQIRQALQPVWMHGFHAKSILAPIQDSRL